MKTTSTLLIHSIVALVLAAGGQVSASIINQTYTTDLLIPDYNPASPRSISDTRNIAVPGSALITGIQVTLNIQGGYNGDYYAYLRHGSTGGFAVLLNRSGVTKDDHDGYADSGFNVVFADNAHNGDIHLYQAVQNPNGESLSGTWQPDGRFIDPSYAIDTTTQSAFLSSFINLEPNGLWTLLVADNSSGSIGTLKGWGLTITTDVAVVPEPSTAIAGAAMAALALLRALKRER
jgi:subtilisin-like proprotein convertase family protein